MALPKVHLLVALVLCLAVAAVAFRYGESKGRDVGYKNGYEAGYEEAPKRTSLDDFYQTQTEKLSTDYNSLVNDYNALLEYANTPRYQPRQPITCNSTNYGINNQFTSINCY